jgi:monothiol glutaredoxin
MSESDVQERIRRTVSDNKIVIYMKGTPEQPRCGFSAATVEVLKSLNVPFLAVNVLDDPEIWRGVKEYADWPTIPQVYVAGQFVGGCDIVRDLHARGELAPLVGKAIAG